MLKKRTPFLLLGLIFSNSLFASTFVEVVTKPSTKNMRNQNYVSNRSPLASSVLIKLPVGTVRPQGWLAEYIKRQKEGLTGNLGEISAWLQKDDNAWLSKDGKGAWGWEEVPYWLKGYANLGYLTDDKKIIKEAKIWIEGALNSQRDNGDFGPVRGVGKRKDYWANMIMLFCLQSYYEYSQDQRILDMMTKYFKFVDTVAEKDLFGSYWQRHRVADIMYSAYWLYNRTGDNFLLPLIKKMNRNSVTWTNKGTLPNWHNVNIAQGFRQPAEMYLLTKKTQDLQQTYDNFNVIRNLYGQVPGGMFGGDEISRPGYDDPRQGIETCGIVEQMLSDEMLMRITGDTFWADNAEDVAFNTYPAAIMADFKSLRYLTSPNLVQSDKDNHAPGLNNRGPFLMMNPFSSRCCQHNHSHGWPYFVENLWMATPDNGLCAAIYGPSKVTAKVADGKKVTISTSTIYPFEENINFSINTNGNSNVKFPLYLRVPKWANDARICINGKVLDIELETSKYVKIVREWQDNDKVTLSLPMSLAVRKWQKNHNSVSIDYGPLTFSLFIKENLIQYRSDKTAIHDSRWQKGADVSKWPSYEILPASPWNYGLIYNENDLKNSFEIVRKAWPKNNYPFTQDSVPIMLKAKGKIIPQWKLDRYKLVAPLQDSPVKSTATIDDIKLIPMGAAKLRISSFPVIGTGDNAKEWIDEESQKKLYNADSSHTFEQDHLMAVADAIVPEHSSDLNVSRQTFWPKKGTDEWISADFSKTKKVSQVAVYWYDDERTNGGCRIPKSWSVSYLTKDCKWKDVVLSSGYKYTTNLDVFNTVEFPAIKTKRIRMNIRLQEKYSGGVLELKVK